MKVIDFNSVWEKYRIKFIQQKNVCWEEVWVLKDINFQAEKGDIIGIIGKNGAGKTTLLRLIAGMLVPDKGKINIQGKVSALMELGAGFNPEFTGIENITLNAAIYGLSGDNLKQRMDSIIKFANLGKFINAPIKYYSQGMYMRLAFALAIYVEPDILLIDDILAVGDEEAQQKCIKKVFELKQAGKTIILVSHDMNMVSKLCNKLILLERGEIVQEGLTAKVIPYYLETVGDRKGIAVLEKGGLRVIFNNGKVVFDYNGFFLTNVIGGYVSFFTPSLNSWSSSFNLSWEVKNFGTDKIIAEGRPREGGLLQVWTLQLEKDCLRWQAEIREEGIKQPHIDLLLIPQYKRWQTLDKISDFPFFASKSNWQALGLNNCPDAVLGVSTAWQDPDCPGLVFEQEDKDILFKPFNTGYEQEARVIQWELGVKNKNRISIKIFPKKEKFTEYIENAKQKFLKKQKEEEQKILKKQEEEKQRLFLEQRKEQVCLRVQRTISRGGLCLYADVDAKSLKLYYKNKEITKGEGLHSSFLLKNVWYGLSSCDWQVKKENHTLILCFHWKKLKFKQLWKLSFVDSALLWEVDSKSFCPFELKLFKFGLLCNPEYKNFFCGRQQSSFPNEFTGWQDMTLIEPQAGLCGLRKQAGFPEIILENKQSLSCIIQNSDEESSCRVLQLSLPQEKINQQEISFSAKIDVLKEKALINNYIREENQKFLKKQKEEKQKILKKQEEEKQRLFLEQRKEQACLRAQRTISYGNLCFYADLENKALRFYYKDKEITKREGLHSTFAVSISKQVYWFCIKNAQWQVDKISEKALVLVLNYESLSLSQVWTLTCDAENTLKIGVEIKVNKTIFFTHRDVKLELQNKYKKWESAYEKGSLLNEQYINDIVPVRLKDNKISKVLLKAKRDKDTPELSFNVFSQLDKRTMNIYKHKRVNDKGLCLNSSLIISKKERLINPGKYTYFEGEIVLGKKAAKAERAVRKISVVEVNNKRLKFVFKQGKGNIFLEDKELTFGLGVYTSVRSLGVWYDSYQAFWQLNQRDDNKMIVTGYWPHVPISQIWEIELNNKNIIFWQVYMEIYEKAVLEIEQANIMLSSQYKNWIVFGRDNGRFTDEYTRNYDILPFRFWYGKAKKISAKVENLPKVTFENNMAGDNFRAIMENTDSLHKARLLQFQKANNHEVLPGKYLYFKGAIKIEPSE